MLQETRGLLLIQKTQMAGWNGGARRRQDHLSNPDFEFCKTTNSSVFEMMFGLVSYTYTSQCSSYDARLLSVIWRRTDVTATIYKRIKPFYISYSCLCDVAHEQGL